MTNETCLGPDLNRHLSRRAVKRPVGASTVEMNVPYHSGSPDSFQDSRLWVVCTSGGDHSGPGTAWYSLGRLPGSNTTIEVPLLNESR